MALTGLHKLGKNTAYVPIVGDHNRYLVHYIMISDALSLFKITQQI